MKKHLFSLLALLSFSAFAQEESLQQNKNFFIGGTLAYHGSIPSEPYFDGPYDQAGLMGTSRYSFHFNEIMKIPEIRIDADTRMTVESESKKTANSFETTNSVSEFNIGSEYSIIYDGKIDSTSKVECQGSTPVITGNTTFSEGTIEIGTHLVPVLGTENQIFEYMESPGKKIRLVINEVIKSVSGNKATVIRNAIHVKYLDYNNNEAHDYLNHSKIEAFCQQ